MIILTLNCPMAESGTEKSTSRIDLKWWLLPQRVLFPFSSWRIVKIEPLRSLTPSEELVEESELELKWKFLLPFGSWKRRSVCFIPGESRGMIVTVKVIFSCRFYWVEVIEPPVVTHSNRTLLGKELIIENEKFLLRAMLRAILCSSRLLRI